MNPLILAAKLSQCQRLTRKRTYEAVIDYRVPSELVQQIIKALEAAALNTTTQGDSK